MEGVTPEEKAAIMQFMGQTYGQIHKQDQSIVGNAGNLRPSSHVMKETFEKTAHIPTVTGQQQQPQQHQQQPQQPQQQEQQQPPVAVAPVTPEQAARELAQAPPVPIYDDVVPVQAPPQVTQAVVNPNQMELDLSEPTKVDMLINLVKEQHLLLKQISLKLDNGKKTTRGHKQK